MRIGIYYVKPNSEEELLEKIKKVLEKTENFDRDILDWKTVAKNYIENFKIL